MSQFIVFFILGGVVFVICFILIAWFILKIKETIKKKYLPQIATNFKCLDRHIVKSRGELIIDNHIYRLGIKHEYEDTIIIQGNHLKYDWYLPEYEIYIEYWGYFGKDYKKIKEEKLKLYSKGKLNLISIEDIMLKDIYSNLEKELTKIIKIDKLNQNVKYCPNCGTVLDKRFLL